MNDRTEQQLMDNATRLAKSAPPPRDLWPAIEAAIAEPAVSQSNRQRSSWFAQAAAAVLLVGASSSMTYVVMNNSSDGVVTTEVLPAADVFEQVSFGSNHELGSEFKDARSALVTDLDTELQRLPLESRETIQANLEVIHDAIHETNAALERDPDNAELQARLAQAYRDELRLLRRVNGISRNVMMRNDI